MKIAIEIRSRTVAEMVKTLAARTGAELMELYWNDPIALNNAQAAQQFTQEVVRLTRLEQQTGPTAGQDRAQFFEIAYTKERQRVASLLSYLTVIADHGCDNTTDDELALNCVERGDGEDLCLPCVASWACLGEDERAKYRAIHQATESVRNP